LWDVATGRERAVLTGHALPVSAVAFAPDGKTLAAALGDFAQPHEEGEVVLWDVESARRLPWLLGHPRGGLSGVSFTPDGRFVVAGGLDETGKIWQLP
jgi:WD40 repeat protein